MGRHVLPSPIDIKQFQPHRVCVSSAPQTLDSMGTEEYLLFHLLLIPFVAIHCVQGIWMEGGKSKDPPMLSHLQCLLPLDITIVMYDIQAKSYLLWRYPSLAHIVNTILQSNYYAIILAIATKHAIFGDYRLVFSGASYRLRSDPVKPTSSKIQPMELSSRVLHLFLLSSQTISCDICVYRSNSSL